MSDNNTFFRRLEDVTIRNLTPYTVRVLNADQEVVHEFPYDKNIALKPWLFTKHPLRDFHDVQSMATGFIGDMPLLNTPDKEVRNMPPPEESVFLIVSDDVRVAHPERSDLISVVFGPTCQYSDDGRVFACTAFYWNPPQE